MKILVSSCIFVLCILYVDGQLATVFSKAKKTSHCATWSAWGQCIWLDPIGRSATYYGRRSNAYMDQLSKDCQTHWFYKLIRAKWGIALNNFFSYVKQFTQDKHPCGMCSYRQSCGYGGKKPCEVNPWTAGRSNPMQFMVAEQACSRKRGLKKDQNSACHADPKLLKRNGGKCRMWPSKVPTISGKSKGLINNKDVAKLLYKAKWSECIPEYKYRTVTKNGRRRRVKTKNVKSCRCCCYPYKPNSKTFKCQPKRRKTRT